MYTISYYATLSHEKWPLDDLSICYSKTDALFISPLNQEGAPWPKVTSNKKHAPHPALITPLRALITPLKTLINPLKPLITPTNALMWALIGVIRGSRL